MADNKLKSDKLKIDDEVGDILQGERLENALAFISFIKINLINQRKARNLILV